MRLTKSGYRPRLLDRKIAHSLQTFGAVSIEGPKWCGKTWTGLNHASSVVYIGNPANNFQERELAKLSPDLVLEGAFPRLVDEWQEVPAIWDAARFIIDQSNVKGQFILTGSATPSRRGVLHSGTGRINQLTMNTMSLFESGDSDGSVSLMSLFEKNLKITSVTNIDFRSLINLIVRGGWPGSIGLDINHSKDIPRSYLKAVIEDDVYRVDEVRRDKNKMSMLLKSLARNESTLANNSRLVRDIKEFESESIDLNTVSDYLNIFRRLYLIDEIPAYSPNLRSATRIGSTAKRHYTDPSLAVAALEATPEMLGNDLNTLGFMFESLCERDLKIYAEMNDAKLFHYRDSQKREIDAVIELPDGSWGAFEIKLGANQIDQAAQNLLDIQSFFENEKETPPSVLVVITGLSNVAYTREDGVMVVPITSLRD